MIHIATVHWAHDRWIDVQLRYFERNIDEPYRVYAWLDKGMREHAAKFFYSTDVPLKEHEFKLTVLGDLVAHAAEPDDVVVFIDGDAFPIAPIVPFLREKLERYPLVAVRRDENNGDPQPHPLFCAMRASLWLELPGDWRRGHTWRDEQGQRVTDVGGNLLGLLEGRGIEWYPLVRFSSACTGTSSITTAAASGAPPAGGSRGCPVGARCGRPGVVAWPRGSLARAGWVGFGAVSTRSSATGRHWPTSSGM